MSMIFTVPLWGSEVANSKTEIHVTNTAVDVGMQRHIYAMSLLLSARVTLLRQAYATAFRIIYHKKKCIFYSYIERVQ